LAVDIANATSRVLAYIRQDFNDSADSSQHPIRAESAEVPVFRFRSFEKGDIRIRALPKCEELLEFDSHLRGFPDRA
jgi:hypothetical protein